MLYALIVALVVLLGACLYLLRRNQAILQGLNVSLPDATPPSTQGEKDASQSKVVLMETLLNNLPIATSVKDINRRDSFFIWNKEASMLYGLSREEMQHEATAHMPANLAQLFADTDREAIQCGEHNAIHRIALHDGAEHTLFMHKKVIAGQDGRRWIVSSEIDITEQEQQKQLLAQQEEALQVALGKAAQSHLMKSDFIAHISHEIRTPLNAIVGFSQYIADTEDAAERHELSATISENAQSLIRLIESILELSQIEAGERPLQNTDILLHGLIDQVINSNPLPKTSPLTLTSDTPEQEYTIQADREAITVILSNFISNAQKFTTEGGITVGYSVTRGDVRLFVKDTGIGIDEERKAEIFDSFKKLDTIQPGIGLGLTIAKALAILMGGTIGVDSTKGKGSTFWIVLPYAPRPANEDASSLSRFYDQVRE